MMNGVLQTGVQGIQRGLSQANQAAQQIATGPAKGAELPELTESAVALKVAEHQVKASAQVVRSADETIGTLLDTMA